MPTNAQTFIASLDFSGQESFMYISYEGEKYNEINMKLNLF